MRSKKLFAVVLFVVLAALGCAMSAFATTINPETDAVFTCDSDPADFNGKTFENLYVLLNGCDNLRATVLPEDNVFVTLRDITVNGTLYYVDDTYDTETGVYTAAIVGENETTAAHYLNFAGESVISRLELECIDPHDCNLGIPYPSSIDCLSVTPTNEKNRGNIIIRGYIDPFLDETTDYYNDLSVKAFPDFSLAIFSNDRVKPDTANFHRFMAAADTLMYYGCSFGSGAAEDCKNLFIELAELPDHKPILDTFERGQVSEIDIYNKYAQSPGETVVRLENLAVDFAYVNNGKSSGDSDSDTFNKNWKPVIQASGYTNIGIMSVYSSLKTDLLVNSPYSVTALTAENRVLPLFIDVMAIGTEGKTADIDLNFTKVCMMNYFGGLDDNSKLTVTFGYVGDGVSFSPDIPSVGILSIYGGDVALIAEQSFQDTWAVGELKLFSGREDFAFSAFSEDETISAYAMRSKYIEIRDTINDLTREDWKRMADECINTIDTNYGNTLTNAHTADGFGWIAYVLSNYSDLPSSDIATNLNTKLHFKNMTFGDISVDRNILERGGGWYSGSCHNHQYGTESNNFHITGIK